MQAPWAKVGGASPQGPPERRMDGQTGSEKAPPPTTFSIKGWNFVGENKPILSTHEVDRWTKDLEMTLPEMVFGESIVDIRNESLGFRYNFNAFDALKACGKEAGIKVSMSQNWMKNAEEHIEEAQPFDWTYSTTYKGTTSTLPMETQDKIDFESLKPRAGDEILWSADVYLFQDELHDNGDCSMQVRIRVTANYFYVLQRLFVRVDNVIFRLKETRLHHRFGDPHALRQYTEREQEYGKVVRCCTQKELRDQILHDANQLAERIPVVFDTTQKFQVTATPIAPSPPPAVHEPTQAEIEAQTRIAEQKFKSKFGNVKPSAGALLQRQKKHETRFFDSGDAFSHKAKSDQLPSASQEEEQEPPQPVLSAEHLARLTSNVAKESDGYENGVKVVQPSQAEIDEQTRIAEEQFKKKFGGVKPSAGALMQRQKKHETRFFDSGDAFSHKAKSDNFPQAPGDEEQEPPQPVLSAEDLARAVSSTSSSASSASSDGHHTSFKVVQPTQAEIQKEMDEQNRLAEAQFKKKFGGVKPSAGALMQRQKKHETRFFDSGDAFSHKAKSDKLPQAPGDEEQEPPQPVLSGEDLARAVSTAHEAREEKSFKIKQPSPAEIQKEMDEQNRLAEEQFKKKFGGVKPSAGALMQRQKKHETRYFDSGDAFSHKAKSDRLPEAPQTEAPQPVLSEDDLIQRSVSSEKPQSGSLGAAKIL